jgi:hypothetical protein
MYLHELAAEEDTYTKDDISSVGNPHGFGPLRPILPNHSPFSESVFPRSARQSSSNSGSSQPQQVIGLQMAEREQREQEGGLDV